MENVILLNVGSVVELRDKYTGQIIEASISSYSVIEKDVDTIMPYVNEVINRDILRYLDFEMGDNLAGDTLSKDIRDLLIHFKKHDDTEGFDFKKLTDSYEIDTSDNLFDDTLTLHVAVAEGVNGKELIVYIACGSDLNYKFTFLNFKADHDSLNI